MAQKKRRAKTLAETIIAEREKRGISQAEFARRLETTQPQLSRWESGRVRPRAPWLKAIAKSLRVACAKLEKLA